MSTTKTTQQLARELADVLNLIEALKMPDSSITVHVDHPYCGEEAVQIPSRMLFTVAIAIRAELGKEAASIKKALQEALANE